MKLNPQNKIALYEVRFVADYYLFPEKNDRDVWCIIINEVRAELKKSLQNQTVEINPTDLARKLHNDYRTNLKSLVRLEQRGFIKRYKNAVLVNCDKYVSLIKHYVSLSTKDQKEFNEDSKNVDIDLLVKYDIPVIPNSRAELIGLKASSLEISEPNTYKNVGENDSETEIPTKMLVNAHSDADTYKNVGKSNLDVNAPAKMLVFFQVIAEHLQKCRCFMDFETLCGHLEPTFLQGDLYAYIFAGYHGESLPDCTNFSLEDTYKIAGLIPTFLQVEGQKHLHFCRSDNNIYNNKNKGSEASYIGGEKEENFEKGFESFGKVEILDFNQPSENIKKGLEEVDEFSQQVLKRAERSMRARNSYRNKPFIKGERIREIIDCLDEVVKSPVDFFIYNFWWGVFDLYCDHYHPSNKIDEEGELVDDPQFIDWKEMLGAALPQDEIYALAKNVYEDLVGAVQQGRYVYGDHSEWEVTFAFDTFEDFIPYEIFQWSPCTMQDKSVPALRVALDRFYDIEAKDVFVPSKGDKKAKNAQNKKLIQLILSTDDSQLSPMESAIKSFYRDFVITGEDNIIDEFTDGRGTALESGGGLPDHLLKPWCYSLPSVGYNEFTGVLSGKYKPIEGIHKKAYIFSAESVVEWNERNGYANTIAHQSIE